MRRGDRLSLLGGGLLLSAALFTGFLFRPLSNPGEFLEFTLHGSEAIVFTSDISGFGRRSAGGPKFVNVVFHVSSKDRCLLMHRGPTDNVVQRLEELLNPASVTELECDGNAEIDGSRVVRSLTVDGERLLSLSDSAVTIRDDRALYKAIAIFGWILGVYFLWAGGTRLRRPERELANQEEHAE